MTMGSRKSLKTECKLTKSSQAISKGIYKRPDHMKQHVATSIVQDDDMEDESIYTTATNIQY
jgi:hypothetical protein